MVTMSSLEKVPPVRNLSSVSRDPKPMPRLLNHPNQKMFSDHKVDGPLLGVIAAQNESSLFSSSLSDLANHKLGLSSNNFLPRQTSTINSHKVEVETLKAQEEVEGPTINNLLPDEEELFSGMVDEMGITGGFNALDDLEDFDVFTCGGGIELEADSHLKSSQRNLSYSWGLNQNQNSVRPVDLISKLPSYMLLGDASPHKDYRILNAFQSPGRLSSASSEIGVSDSFQSFPQVSNFHPHSPRVQLHNVVNKIPRNSLDTVTSVADNIGLNVPSKEIHRLGSNGQVMDLNDRVLGYSPNGIHVHGSMPSKSNSFQQHNLQSLIMANSPSFTSNHSHQFSKIPGSQGAPQLMMNMVSPVNQLQVGSAPLLKTSLWDTQQVYTVECRETLGYHMGAIRSIGIPGFSTSHPREISSRGSLPRAHGFGNYTEMSKGSGLHSPQRMSPMFQERNAMNSLPTSFSSHERARSRRNETNLSYTDRKHYELNFDRILRGEDTRTTLMIKNIPNKYTSKMLLATIDEHHRGKYDFIYLPIDFKNKCNMGYAFINMVDPFQIVAFNKTFEGRKWEKFNSEKVATLAYARIQGKSALIAHFQNSSLMNEDKRCRPILFHTNGPNAGDQEPFPVGTGFRSKPARLQVSVGGDD